MYVGHIHKRSNENILNNYKIIQMIENLNKDLLQKIHLMNLYSFCFNK